MTRSFAKVASDFLISLFAPILDRVDLGSDGNVIDLVDYSARGLTLFMQVLTSVISSKLLMMSVVVLYFVHLAGIRLGILGMFTIVFSWRLALFAGTDRNEIFGATAAYCPFQIRFEG